MRSFTPKADAAAIPGFAINAFIDAGREKEGIAFLEKHFPNIAAGNGMVGRALVSQLASLYEGAGYHDRAFQFYRDAINHYQYHQRDAVSLARFRNNLAYQYSTTNKNVDEGIDLVLLAMSSRSASYIDTLGWLLYRRGDYKEAETEIRRAIRSTNSSVSELSELYDHLAEVLEKQGRHEEAVNVRIFLKSLKQH